MRETDDDPARDHVDRLVAQRRRESPDLPLEGLEILGRVRRLALLTRPRIEAVFARHGLDAGEFDVLATLERAGPPYQLRPTELYRTLLVSSGGLSDRLNRLAERGLVARERATDDRRSLPVALTPEGLSRIRAAYAEDMAVEAEMLAPLDPEDRDTLVRLLRKLLRSLEEPPRGEDP